MPLNEDDFRLCDKLIKQSQPKVREGGEKNVVGCGNQGEKKESLLTIGNIALIAVTLVSVAVCVALIQYIIYVLKGV